MTEFMRIWDIHPKHLCRQHLLGEHRELHAVWNILTMHKGRGGYARHPETLRWAGKLPALNARHDELVAEMHRRGYDHRSPLPRPRRGSVRQDVLLATPREQRALLSSKPCSCFA